MSKKISTQQLEKPLRGEFKTLIAEAVNGTQPGRIILTGAAGVSGSPGCEGIGSVPLLS